MKSKGALTTLSQKKWVSSLLAAFFTCLVVFFQTRELLASALFDNAGNLVFRGQVLFRDSTIHLGIINELIKTFPPNNFSYTAGGLEVLKNYHYFYDLILAVVIKLTGLPLDFVYFQLAPVIISMLLCLTIYLSVYRLSGNRMAAAFGIFFVVFASSLGPLIPGTNQGVNIFMSDQLMSVLINPHGGLSVVWFLALYLLLNKYERGNKLSLIVYTILLSVSFSLKAYGGIVFAVGAIFAAFVFYIQKKDKLVPICTVLGLCIMAILVFVSIDGKVPGLIFAPFWTIDRMIGDVDRLNQIDWVMRKDVYKAGDSIIVIPLYSLFLIVYVVGGLGLRILGIYAVWKRIKNPIKISPSFSFLLICAVVGLIIPVIFNQGKKAYDIVQFTAYFLAFMGLMFSVALFELTDRMKNKKLQAFIILSFVFLFISINYREMKSKVLLTGDLSIMSKELVEATNYIKKNSKEDAIFLLTPSDFNLESHWFNYLASRRTVYTGWRFSDQIGVNREKATRLTIDVLEGKRTDIDYDYVFLYDRETIHPPNLTTWFKNDKVVILKKK